jgi:hypothetical protein
VQPATKPRLDDGEYVCQRRLVVISRTQLRVSASAKMNSRHALPFAEDTLVTAR